MARVFARLILIVLLILLVLVGAVYWLERVSLLNTNIVTGVVNSLLTRSSKVNEITLTNDTLLIDRLRLEKKENELANLQIEINRQQLALETEKQKVADGLLSIEASKDEILIQKKTLNQIQNQFENRNERIKQTAISLVNIPPQNAVDILSGYDDELIVDTLLVVNQMAEEEGTFSIVPYWLSLMDAKRASDVQKWLVNSDR